MASQIFKRGPSKPSMNITPLIDVVFLLIVFFMLVSTIVAHDAAPMIVPTLDESRTRPMEDSNRVMVSVVPQAFNDDDRRANPLRFEGLAREVRVGTQRYTLSELADVTEQLRALRERNPELEVLLRADAAIYYDEVQPVMTAITAAGIETVKMVAYMPDQGPTPTE